MHNYTLVRNQTGLEPGAFALTGRHDGTESLFLNPATVGVWLETRYSQIYTWYFYMIYSS